jgi:hypothetical protein
MAVETTPVTTIAAQPGTFIIQRMEIDGRPAPYKIAIIGWSTHYDGEVRPVTLDPEALIGADWAVLFPDGRVERMLGGHLSWETLDDWLNEAG